MSYTQNILGMYLVTDIYFNCKIIMFFQHLAFN